MKFELTDIHLRYLLNTRRYLVWTIGLAVLAGVLVLFGVVPQALAAAEAFQQFQSEQTKLKQLERKAVQLDQVTEEVLISQAQVVDKVLPSRKPLLETLAALSAVADITGVSFEQIGLTPGTIAISSAQRFATSQPDTSPAETENPRFDSLDLDVSVLGSIGNITAFLRQVERIAPLTTIQKMELRPRQDVPAAQVSGRGLVQQGTFQADLRLSSMFFTQPIAVQVDTPLPDFGGRQQEILTEIRGYTFTTLEQQREIIGGGGEDLFDNQELIDALESLSPGGVGIQGGTGDGSGGSSQLESLEGLSPEVPATQPAADDGQDSSLNDLQGDLDSALEFELPEDVDS